jgi:hypothetical protein
MDEIKKTIGSLCEAYAMIGATEAALELGNPVLQNVVMIGALEGLGLVPFTRDDFVAVIGSDLSEGLLELNLKAYDVGFRLAERPRRAAGAKNRACPCERGSLPARVRRDNAGRAWRGGCIQDRRSSTRGSSRPGTAPGAAPA